MFGDTMKGTTLDLGDAENIAKDFIDRIADTCERLEIAGSVRRKKKAVGDIEVVATPIIKEGMEKTAFGFDAPSGKEINLLDERIKELAARGFIEFDRKSKNQNKVPSGPRYYRISYHYQARIEIYPIDLFVVLPDAQDWGVIFTIRTGSAEFSHQLAILALDKRMKIMGGRLWDSSNKHIKCDTEEQFFEALGIKYIEPKDRQPTFCKFERKSGEIVWECKHLVALTPSTKQYCDLHEPPANVLSAFKWKCVCGSEFDNSKDAKLHQKECHDFKNPEFGLGKR